MGDEPTLDKYTDTGNMCYAGEVKTPFATGTDIDKIKAMLATAKPEQVIEVADAWKNIHDHLVSGGGSVKSDFDKAVDHILQHWEGESADEFSKRAKMVSKQIADCAKYANYTSVAMRNAGQRLSEIKPKVDAIEKPSGFGSAMDKVGDGFSRDDEKWRGEISGNQGAQKALDGHEGDLSAGKEEHLKAAALMETLAITYSSQTQTMGSWNKRPPPRDPIHGQEDYPGDPGGVAPVPVAVTPDGGGAGAAAVGASRTGSVVGRGTPKSTSPAVAGTPAAATKVDGISGGTATTPNPAGANGSGPTGGVTGGAGAGAGGAGGVAGGPGYVGQASGNRGGAGAGAGARAGVGARGGVGGRVPAGLGAGAGGAGGAGGKGIGAAAGRGPLARQRGGTLDTPQQGQGAARQGGQGLHSSRGGSMAGERGRGPNGLMGGGVAGNNARRNQDEKSQGERPDYLVEDEETWMPKRRDVTPPTIG
ncbi:hypothetical protein DB35_27290 [Streptomyces abyssalis]|uniref:PPE family domain-containing protein n=1 Tax=Streptomyces abyssalis TaxID=933944 RepID=A0A1E7JJB9_9ACTN|nr:hypothetical protein [Streptomyces abyssalis]OEU87194.1 hypothetical protein DB35_27290 [Streptomyces abyssalis]OEU87728.1 hypothetical protein AN215_15395 [Streptomyces abyssalis]